MLTITSLLSFLPFLNKLVNFGGDITKQIIDLKVARANAETDQEKIHADENIKVLETRRDIMIAEAQYNAKLKSLARGFLLFPVGVILWKILIWDQALQLGSTPALGVDIWRVIYIILAFYFAGDFARIIKG